MRAKCVHQSSSGSNARSCCAVREHSSDGTPSLASSANVSRHSDAQSSSDGSVSVRRDRPGQRQAAAADDVLRSTRQQRSLSQTSIAAGNKTAQRPSISPCSRQQRSEGLAGVSLPSALLPQQRNPLLKGAQIRVHNCTCVLHLIVQIWNILSRRSRQRCLIVQALCRLRNLSLIHI